jgi:N-acetylglucosaminyl-diphospho-decaprenol L-rhamnosyltransferase
MSPMDAPELGVIIVSYNTRELLDACLRSLIREIKAESLRAQIHVVDNASADGSAGWVAEQFVDTADSIVHLLALQENVGFTAGNNLVLDTWQNDPAAPRRILLINPDAEMMEGALVTLVRALDEQRNTACVGPSLHYADGSFQHAAFRFPGPVQTLLDLFPVDRLTDSTINGRYSLARYAAGAPFEVDFVLGACLLVKQEALREVGPLDEGFFMYCEEIDWCRRFRTNGWKILLVPKARVLHHGAASSGQFREFSFVTLWRSRRRYQAKHAPLPRRLVTDLIIRLGLAKLSLRDTHDARRGRLSSKERAKRAKAYRSIFVQSEDPAGVVR